MQHRVSNLDSNLGDLHLYWISSLCEQSSRWVKRSRMWFSWNFNVNNFGNCSCKILL